MVIHFFKLAAMDLSRGYLINHLSTNSLLLLHPSFCLIQTNQASVTDEA